MVSYWCFRRTQFIPELGVFCKYHGQGTWTSPSGYKYEWEWKDGMRSGLGTQTYPDGGKYEGEWKDGKRWNGTTYEIDGTIFGNWVNGKLKVK